MVELIGILLVPAAAAVLSFFLAQRRAAIVTLIAGAGVAVLAVLVAGRVVSEGTVTALEGWLTCDPLAALVLVLVAFVGLTAALFSVGYIRGRQVSNGDRRGNYYPLYNLFLLSMLAVPLVANIALVWISVALTTLLSAFLVAYEDTPEALEAAWKYVVLTTLGAVIALLGIVFLYWGLRLAGGGPFTWAELLTAAPHAPRAILWTGFLLVLIGFGTKAGLAPMHTWLPDAHSQAPAPICALLSGVETTTALYVVLRLFPVLNATGQTDAHTWFVVFGLISTGAGALLLVYVRDYKRMFAFSTVEHMGIIMVAVGLGSQAHFGAAYQMAAHALAKSFCFYAAGAVALATGTQEIAGVRGLIRVSPAAAGALILGSLAIAGAPPFAVFMSEFTILKAGLGATQYLVVGLLAVFIVVAFCAMMQHVNRMIFGLSGNARPAATSPATCSAALILAAVPVLVLGVYLPTGFHRLLAGVAAALGGAP
ncbi:MAG: proton-conducting transporter membrane subunit [Alphaproteobacteria bacterium]